MLKNKRKQKSAFTLLELIIVMAIIVTLLGIGFSSLIGFRNTVQLQSVYSEFVENMKSLQNKARNSSSVNGTAPFLYAIFIGSNLNTYTFGNCTKPPAGATNFICNIDPKAAVVNIANTNVTFTAVNKSCQGLGFVRLPGDVISIDPVLAINQSGSYSLTNSLVPNLTKCDYTITNTQINVSKTVSVNLKTGAISLL